MNAVRKVISVLLATAMVTILTFATAMPVKAHYPGAVIQSEWASTIPTIDGVFSPGEWADAAMVDLQAADPANEIEAYIYFKNDGDYLYALVDVAGDTIGFAMDGELEDYLGIYDGSTDRGDQWPFLRWDTIYIYEYGDLILATGIAQPVGGEAYPVKATDLMALWVGLALAGIMVAGIFVIRLRRAS